MILKIGAANIDLFWIMILENNRLFENMVGNCALPTLPGYLDYHRCPPNLEFPNLHSVRCPRNSMALEEAGIEFINKDGWVGVRLKLLAE